MKPFAEIVAKKTGGDLISPTRQPDLGPFNINAVVRKNLLQTPVFQNASLAKAEKNRYVYQKNDMGAGG